jgi:ribosomal protein S18 acetylase RimI-like enzyme
MDINGIKTLERRAFAAWPALRTLTRDGWVLRFADGHTKRANSINPVATGTGDLAARIAAAEAEYANAGLPAVFRVTPLAENGLDDALAARGYAAFDESLVMAGPLPQGAADPDVTIDADPIVSGWLADFGRATQADAKSLETLARMFAQRVTGTGFARLTRNGKPLAFAMAVPDCGDLGFFEVLTVPQARGQGLARRTLLACCARAAAQGATRAYLQVTAGNASAIALYRKLGLEIVYRYFYRMR